MVTGEHHHKILFKLKFSGFPYLRTNMCGSHNVIERPKVNYKTMFLCCAFEHGDLSRVYHASYSLPAGTDSSSPSPSIG